MNRSERKSRLHTRRGTCPGCGADVRRCQCEEFELLRSALRDLCRKVLDDEHYSSGKVREVTGLDIKQLRELLGEVDSSS